MKHMTILIGAVIALSISSASAADLKAEVALRAAREQETVKGDLKGAIEEYNKILATYSQDRSVAARALLRLGECYEKLGRSDAQKTYERLLREYPEQKEAAAARAKLAGTRDHWGDVTVERVWAGEDVNLEGNLSADGRYLAFVDYRTGRHRAAVRDLSTGENRILTGTATGECYQTDVLFSSDGRQIAYRCDASIHVIGFDGTHDRQIARTDSRTSLYAWSPDGKKIAAVNTDYAGDKTSQILLISTTDGSITRLKSTGWRAPTLGGFSPDGRYLVYSLPNLSSGKDGGIFAIAVDGSREAQLVPGTGGDLIRGASGAPVWTPDGRAVVFLSDRSGTKDLWWVRVAEGRPEGPPALLKAQAGSILLKGFARDGSLYYGSAQLDTDVYTAAFDPEKLTADAPARITPQFIGSNFEPEPSPDGKLIAFLRKPAGELGPRPSELVIRSVASGEERVVAKTRWSYFVDRNIRWFPDSRSVLVEDPMGQRKIFERIDVVTGKAQTLFEGPYAVGTAELSRDGKALFYSIRDDGSRPELRLVRRDLETGQETDLYRQESNGVTFFGLTLSQDGRQLAFSANTTTGLPARRSLLAIPTSGGAVKELYRGNAERPQPHGATWTKDGRYVIAPASLNGRTELMAFPIAGGEPQGIALSMPEIASPSISPDGRQILFTGYQSKKELWVIRNLMSQLQASR
jgi:Tol biopolymer transport system component